MPDFRRVTETLSVSPQITPADVAEAARLGFRTIVNNRPDGEEPGQPLGAEIEAAARAHGLDYLPIPVRGGPTPEQVAATARWAAEAAWPVLAFCRSGMRSVAAWSLAERQGGRDRDELVGLGRAAGYDLTPVL